MTPSASRIAAAGLATAAITITVFAALLYGDVARETILSREVIAAQQLKDGLEAVKDGLVRLDASSRLRAATGEPSHERDIAASRVSLQADLDYLRAKAAELPRFAGALASVEAPVLAFADAIAFRNRAGATPATDGQFEAALGATRAAQASVGAEINARTVEQIRLGEVRRTYVTWLLGGTIAVLLGLVIAFREALARARADRARIEQLAHHDALTGLPNRGLLDDRLAQAVVLAHRELRPLAVLLFDLDGFKPVNDTLGHAAGDELLAQVGARARDCMRASDTVGRLGGDEFLAILPATGPTGAASVAAKLLEALGRPYALSRSTAVVGVSIGGAFLPANGLTPDELTRAADEALYCAKREGRNRYRESETAARKAAAATGTA